MLCFCQCLINIIAWELVPLSHVQVLNKDSYHPKTVTLDPSPACMGMGSIWVFIGIFTSFFSLSHILTTRIPCSFHAPINATLPGWCLGSRYYVCTLPTAGTSVSRYKQQGPAKHRREKKRHCLFHLLPSSLGRLLSPVDSFCHC